ncbi:lipolytic protein G-D-S-L family [Mucilaginibacter ginsenosidivorans]|uniref:Lipolytic protein G-D-S-L family n=2 Tax=Mucilaginibacter ginsenosidivorans TaxID=398053 RepID=A0A5B8V349_9SPHI|nr:lipolytic protein G-D-S-L family [Mucilaginibacter ginsenosidivorans]
MTSRRSVILGGLMLLSSLDLYAQSKEINIVYIGDSITQGVQLADPVTQAPPATASMNLQHREGIATVNFSNQGRSGFTTVDFLPPGETFKHVEVAASELAQKPGLLIFSIMLGTNDSAITGPNGAPVSPENYFGNLKSIIDKLLNDYPESKILLHYPTWYSPNTYNGAQYLQQGLDRLQSYFPQLRKLVKYYAAANPGKVFIGDKKAFGYFKKNALTDLIPENGHRGTFHLHPNVKGAAALGSYWANAIYKLAMASK